MGGDRASRDTCRHTGLYSVTETTTAECNVQPTATIAKRSICKAGCLLFWVCFSRQASQFLKASCSVIRTAHI